MSNIDKQAVQAVADLKAGYTLGHADVEIIQQMALDAVTLHDALEAAEKRIAELEAKLETADKLQDSAFRHGLQHGFSLGQTDNQAGFEECLSAYGPRGKDNG
ncbi:hypothetical protein V6X01_24115 [Enterobacter hormaechei]|uniref:hypothetical protein n=1 Tax=Enterobacter hormaechei TaxID=158836 RepID=UPI00287D4791|nr:hypothetical protein [Enterobacter hormaechei subsp. steigerwaltii]HED3104748.1 hypothetical protein [Enterobacter hormaechei subsp. steigerwaltii]